MNQKLRKKNNALIYKWAFIAIQSLQLIAQNGWTKTADPLESLNHPLPPSAESNQEEMTTSVKKVCFGEGVVCVIPNINLKNSIGDGVSTPLSANIIQQQVGVKIGSKMSNFALEVNWSLLPFVLAKSVQNTADHAVEEVAEDNRNKLKAFEAQSLNLIKKATDQALNSIAPLQGTPAYDRTKQLILAQSKSKIAQLDFGVAAKNHLINESEEEHIKEISKRISKEKIRTSIRDVMLVYNDGTFLFEGGWGRAGRGFNPSAIGDEALKYTSTGSAAVGAEPGTSMQSLNISTGIQTPKFNLVAWINQDGALFINGSQYLANALRESKELYGHYSSIHGINAGGLKACAKSNDQQSSYCLALQVTSKGETPTVRIEQKLWEDLTIYLIASYASHSQQIKGLSTRAQVTYKVYDSGKVSFFLSVFAEYNKDYLDYSYASTKDIGSDGRVQGVSTFGVAAMSETKVAVGDLVGLSSQLKATGYAGIEYKAVHIQHNGTGGASLSDNVLTGSLGLRF